MTVSQSEILVEWLEKLIAREDVPDDKSRNFNDGGIKRLMPDDLKMIILNIKEGINHVGHTSASRYELVKQCDAKGMYVRWGPTEQDSSGWLSGKLITKKGTFYFC